MRAAAASAALLVSLGAQAGGPECTATLGGLWRLTGDASFPQRWTETGMPDGKPLVLEISEAAGALHLRFEKTGEGLWAEGTSTICSEHGLLTVRFDRARTRPGPAASWLLRQSIAAGARFELARRTPSELVVSTPGWRGTFAPLAPTPASR